MIPPGPVEKTHSISGSVWAAVAILLAATVLRGHALGREGLWCDEAYTALTVRLPLAEMISMLLRIDDAPPLYYLLQKANVALLGDSERALRMLSVAAGIGSAGILLWTAQRRNSSEDLWAACFFAVATTGVFHARQARSYGLLLLLALVLVLSARHMLQGGARAGPLLALSACGLCLTHHVGFILVLTSLVLWGIGSDKRPRLRSWILWHLPALIVSACFWIGARTQLEAHIRLNAWIAHYWETHSILLAPLYSLSLFLPVGLPIEQFSVGFASPGRVSAVWSGVSLLFGLVCFATAGMHGIRKRNRVGEEVRVEVGFLLLPLLALQAVSFVTTPVYVLGRTDVLAYPAFVLLIGRGLASLPWRRAAPLFLLFWAAMSMFSLGPSYGLWNPTLAKGADRELAKRLSEAGLTSGDWLVHTYMTSPSIEYYLDRFETPHQAAWFPFDAGENTASDYPAPADSLDTYLDQACELIATMEAVVPRDRDIWVFGLVAPETEAISRIRESGVATAEQIAYPVGLLVYSLVGRSPVPVAFVYQQDWVAGERVVLRIPQASWTSRDEIPPTEIRVGS
jgi:4-amino-4-deoxy-L-arabinose transferase-like glycosyltransferase